MMVILGCMILLLLFCYGNCDVPNKDPTKGCYPREDRFNLKYPFRQNMAYKLTTPSNSTYTKFYFKLIDTRRRVTLDYAPLKTSYVIRAHQLKAGYYYVVKKYSASRITRENDIVRYCHVQMSPLKPTAVITGGTLRTVPPNVPATFFGSESFSNDPDAKDPVTYTWTCSGILYGVNQYCNNKTVRSTSPDFTLDGRYLLENSEVTVTLTVQQGYVESDIMVQQVKVLYGAASLEITCLKNCPPASATSDISVMTYLEAKCIAGCQNIRDLDYNWNVRSEDDLNFMITVNDIASSNGFFGLRFMVKPNVFKGGFYEFKVRLIGKMAEASFSVYFMQPPTSITSCETIPYEGVALETEFKLKCAGRISKKQTFALMIQLGDEMYVGGMTPEIYDDKFMLPYPAQKKFYVRIWNSIGGPYTDVDLSTNVKSPITGNDAAEITKVINVMDHQIYDNAGNTNKSLKNALSDTDVMVREEAITALQIVVNQIMTTDVDHPELNNFMDNLKNSVISDLIYSPILSTNEVERLTKTFTNLMSKGELPASDPLVSKLCTSVCKKMAVTNLMILKQEKRPIGLAQNSQNISKSLSECVEVNTNPNYEALAPVKINVSTPAPNIDEDVPTENYDNYVDYDDNYYANLNNLHEATQNIINTTSVAAKIMAMTTAIGEPPKETITKKTKICVTKNNGRSLYNVTIECDNVRLLPSLDWRDDDHPYDILLSVWSRDLMWWNQAKVNVSTSVLNAEFWHSTCKEPVNTFKNPVKIYFKLNSNVTLDFVFQNLKIPSAYPSKQHQDLNEFIYVRRITLQAKTTIRIVFNNLNERDILDVTVTKFKYPTIEDFPQNQTISQMNPFLQFENKDDYSVWCYLAILPNRNAVAQSGKLEISLNISFALATCIKWIPKDKTWQQACQLGGPELNVSMNNTLICRCSYFSVIAGYVINSASIPQDIIDEEFELKFEGCYMIFYTVFSVYLLYSIMALFTACKRLGSFYYLADNRKKDLYAYLLIIRTGYGPNSGTTSNIVIKLVGPNRQSLSHVLNYPDPYLRILQRFNEDLFILTTDRYLEELQEIQIWFDCIGTSPAWFCKDIVVYDLQRRVCWYFYVNQWLYVEPEKEVTYLTVTPSKNQAKNVFCDFNLHTFGLYHTWHLISSQENFAYFKRLTVILSKIITIFFLNLVYYGVPRFSHADGLDLAEYKVDFKYIVIGVVTSAVAFVIHLVISTGFRVSKIQFSKRDLHNLKCPLKVTIICWCVIVTFIVMFTSLLIVWGFRLPQTKSMMWLTSCTIAIFTDVIFYENAVSVAVTFWYRRRQVEDIWQKFNKLHLLTEQQRRYLYKKFKTKTLLRPYFRHLYYPLPPSEIKHRKILAKKRRHIIDDLQDLFMFGIYIMILYGVILFDRDDMAVFSKNHIIDMMNGMFTKTMDFEGSIETIFDLNKYVNFTLIPTLQPNYWYGNYVISDPGLTLDMSNKFLGVVRFRQHRVKRGECEIADEMEFLNMTCWPEFAFKYKETRKFGYSWSSFTPYFEFDRLREIWAYKTNTELKTLPFFGEFATYPGGGYVSLLGRTLYNSQINFKVYVKRQWIDDKTRAVFIEFLLYNVNSNLFNSVRLSVEISATGYVFKDVHVDSARLVYVQSELFQMTIFMFFIFVSWVSLLFLRQSFKIVTRFKLILKDFWFYADFIIISLSITCVVLKFVRSDALDTYLNVLESVKHNEFVSYFVVFACDYTLTTVSAFLVCVATVRIWRVLRFGIIFRILEKTLIYLSYNLVGLLLAFGTLQFAFGFWASFLFGSEFKAFYSFGDISRTQLTLFIQPGQISMAEVAQGTIKHCYFIFYFLLIKGFMYIFITTIILSYCAAKMDFSQLRDSYTLKNYILERLDELPDRIRSYIARLSGGKKDTAIDNNQSLVTPKSDAFRYANCIETSQANFDKMILIIKSLMRNSSDNVQNLRLMLELCYHFIFNKNAGEKRLFYMVHANDEKISIIDDDRLVHMEFVTRALLDRNYGLKSEAEIPIRDDLKNCLDIVKNNQRRIYKCELAVELLIRKVDELLLDLQLIEY